jgi:hypothetical protein
MNKIERIFLTETAYIRLLLTRSVLRAVRCKIISFQATISFIFFRKERLCIVYGRFVYQRFFARSLLRRCVLGGRTLEMYSRKRLFLCGIRLFRLTGEHYALATKGICILWLRPAGKRVS